MVGCRTQEQHVDVDEEPAETEIKYNGPCAFLLGVTLRFLVFNLREHVLAEGCHDAQRREKNAEKAIESALDQFCGDAVDVERDAETQYIQVEN